MHLSAYLADQKFTSSSAHNRAVSAIKSFFRWLEQNEVIERSRIESYALQRTATKNPTIPFTDEAAEAMIEAPKVSTIRGNAARLCFVLLFNLGLRREDIAEIRMADVSLEGEHQVLTVSVKGGKLLKIPLSQYILFEIESYRVRHYRMSGNEIKDYDYLLQANSKISPKPISVSTIYRMVKKYAKIVGVEYNVSPHSGRATTICHLLEKGVPHRQVADLVGHSNIRTTQGYDKKRDGHSNSAAFQVTIRRQDHDVQQFQSGPSVDHKEKSES